ncbi:MAG: RagB/SusD family nutrient uptake outer membrane protein [Mariniphaga sp.]
MCYFHGDFGGENIALSSATTDHLYYMYNYQHTPTNYHLNSLWSTCYKGIVNANKVISSAEKGTPRMNHVIGEMHYLRAFFYLNLVSIWGRPYNQNPEQNPGVPIVLDAEPDIDNMPPRATVKEVYAQIESDLLTAAALMNEFNRNFSEYNIFASEQAAYALLSRLYLYMEDNAKAEEFATLKKKISLNNRSASVDVPDFTRGAWKTNVPLELTLKGGGTTNVVIKKANPSEQLNVG